MKMSDTTESIKYKWTPESTSLLVSVWTDRQVQKQLDYAVKPQLIWESIAKYMRKKGYDVTGKQCRSRMKQVLVCYREAKKAGTRAGIERYYESIDKVLENKRLEKCHGDEIEIETDIGMDVVDATPINLRSPEKATKTRANFLMRQNKFEEPSEPLLRQIDLDTARYTYGHPEYYADSSESNETVLVRPHRSVSPTIHDARQNMEPKILRANINKNLRQPLPDERYRYNTLENRFSDIPLKNTVQNVQNQIIQENMMLRNQLSPDFLTRQIPQTIPQSMDYFNIGNIPQRNYIPDNLMYSQPTRMSTNLARIQSHLQQCALTEQMDAKNFGPFSPNVEINGNFKPLRPQSNYPQDIGSNMNDALCQSKMPKTQNLAETYDQDTDMFPVNQTAVTNNATFNDDTLSIDFAQDCSSPSENGLPSLKNDSPDPPNAPLRKKKAQKLEQLMINALTSQTEVVNKILAAQDSMVSKILDRDHDRQSRLENRLDQLMTVVQATVLNKSPSSKESEAPTVVPASATVTTVPTCFSPPPRPGLAPPKLDLVPPKPCRVPCTNPPSNVEVIQQNPLTTKPGVIRPQKPGTIWSKLGPVSASPFVQAQKEMNIAAIAQEWRTKSSAERKIANSPVNFNVKVVIDETIKFLQSEKLMEERIENARRTYLDDSTKPESQPARRKLFNPALNDQQGAKLENQKAKAPSANVILTQTFLDIERQSEEKTRMNPIPKPRPIRRTGDELLSGQGEGFDRLSNLGQMLALNTSTPAKVDKKYEEKFEQNPREKRVDMNEAVPKQTIQELAELVMQSERWKTQDVEPLSVPRAPPAPNVFEVYAQRQGYNKAKEWLHDRYSYGVERQEPRGYSETKKYPMGFVNPANYPEEGKINHERHEFRPIGFRNETVSENKYAKQADFLEGERRHANELQKVNQREPINKYAEKERVSRRGKESDGEENDEYLDTTTTMKPYRKTSLTSSGGSATGSLKNPGCVIS